MSQLTKPIGDLDINASIDELGYQDEPQQEAWLLMLFRGIALFLFGFAAVIWPGITTVALAWVFSVFILIQGTLDIINGFRSISSKGHWFLKIFLGVIEVGVAMYLLRSGFVVTTAIFLQAAGLIFILQAIINTVTSFTSGYSKGIVALSLLSAFFTFVIGVFLVRHPVSTGLTFVWVIGFYGIIAGAISMAAAFALRHEYKQSLQ
jgi:uncharacterized membrane protein HdeD (DUF308 family)